MVSLSVRSFAKLNIALDVLNRRLDGYHDIESVIQPISLCDRLIISKRDDCSISVRSSDPSVPSGPGNLAYRAGVSFLEATGLRAGIEIDIEKTVPMQAGLGGGSGNAAAALLGLNELFGRPLERESLLCLAAELGSDIPFFLAGGTAFVSGRGEKLSELPDVPLDFVIVKPDCGISTAWAYGQLDAEERKPRYAARAVADAMTAGDRNAVVRAMSNDFQSVAERQYPEIGSIRRRLLESGADGAMLAGSGSAVFGAFTDASACDAAFDAVKEEYPRVFRARTLLRKELTPDELIRR